MKKKQLFYFIIAIILSTFLILISGTTKIFKTKTYYAIDQTKCIGCYLCMTQFSCPQGAIKRNGIKAIIDTTLCNACGKCMTEFHCLQGAIYKYTDVKKTTFGSIKKRWHK